MSPKMNKQPRLSSRFLYCLSVMLVVFIWPIWPYKWLLIYKAYFIIVRPYRLI